MNFSSADYPVFLIAVFLIYGLLRAGKLPGALARLGLLLLLGDLVYLLLSKSVGSLWDPLGALAFRAIAEDPPPWRHPLEYLAGAAVFGGGVVLGLYRGHLLAGDRGQQRTALLSALALAGMGVAILVTYDAGTLEQMSAGFATHGHLIFLLIYGVALGAGMTEAGRTFGRMVVLFLVSAIFYHSWAAGMLGAYKYLLLVILGTIVLDYYLALWIHGARAVWSRRALLVLSLVSNLGILAVFKYFDFFLGALQLPIEPFALILPAGISFHTFQSLSYTIDVYRGKLVPTRSVLQFATFVLFFPQLVAGPIVRAEQFLPQLATLPPYDRSKAADGLFRILVGLFKKIALADFLAIALVDRVFAEPGRFSGVEVLFGVYAYAFQIYLDFSAYSDIAIGSAQLLGFDFPENFRSPYRSANLQDFWRRWHITLSNWLRDYLYIPLGGSQGGSFRTYRNLTITMLLGGLWHGGNWTFIVWGALHGGGLAVTRVFQRRAEAAPETAHRLLAAMLIAGLAGFAVHSLLADAITSFGQARGFDGAWLHLALGWAYVTPAWAAVTAWLTLEEAPAIGPPVPRILRAALPARLIFLGASALLGLAIWKGPAWTWAPLLALSLGTACLGDVFEHGPDGRAARRYAAWAMKRAAAILLTFHYVCFGWIFFRAVSFGNARDVLTQIGGLATDAANLGPTFLLVFSLAVAAHLFPPGTFRWLRERFIALPAPAQAALMVGCALALRKLSNPIVVPFIYFQF